MANDNQVANERGHSGNASRMSSSITRFGPVPIVVPVPPQFADIETHIANIARFEVPLRKK